MVSFVSSVVKLNQKYHLIEKDQRILLAISGGVDSLSMAKTLAEYRRIIDLRLELRAIYVRISELAQDNRDIQRVMDFLNLLDIPLEELPGSIATNVEFGCYSCARERRKQLCIYADKYKFDAVAFGHNLDDYLETGFMNLIYSGHLESLQARQKLFDGKITIIRPLLSISKKHILANAKKQDFPHIPSNCRFEADNKRASIRKKMIEFQRLNKAFYPNLRRAINQWNGLEI